MRGEDVVVVPELPPHPAARETQIDIARLEQIDPSLNKSSASTALSTHRF
jgi:hypothetical protein